MCKMLRLSYAFFALAGAPAIAETFPSRPVTLVVPFPAGGPTDVVARMIGDGMSRRIGQPFVIENVSGAGGTVGALRVVRAPADGHTLLVHHVGLATAATLYRKLSFDVRTAFAPIGLISDTPMVIVGRTDLEPQSLSSLTKYMAMHGKNLKFGHAGLGSGSYLCGLMLASAIGHHPTNVPYKGGAPLMNDLIGKHIDLGCEQATNAIGPINGKLIKAYAVTTRTPLVALNDVPTAERAGMKDFEVNIWQGLLAPKGTRAEIVAKLAETLQAVLATPDVVSRLEALATFPVSSGRATPEALQRLLASEIDRWAPLIKSSGQFAD